MSPLKIEYIQCAVTSSYICRQMRVPLILGFIKQKNVQLETSATLIPISQDPESASEGQAKFLYTKTLWMTAHEATLERKNKTKGRL